MQKRIKKRLKIYRKNLKEVRLYILLRFLSIIVLSAIFSTTATLLNLNGKWLTSQSSLLTGLGLFCVLFLFFDIIFMRRDYYRLTHKRKYRMVNFISHGMFAVINIVSCYFFSHTYLYAFIFSITKFARYSHLGLSSLMSAVIFNAVVLISVQFAPVGMKWLHLHHG